MIADESITRRWRHFDLQRNYPPFSLPQRSDTDALARKQFARFVSNFHQDVIFQWLSRLGMRECALHQKRARGRSQSH
jgi:hypothetical protein